MSEQKLQTLLNYFRYGSHSITRIHKLTWYKLVEDNEQGWTAGTGMSHSEIKALADYMANTINFDGPKDYFECKKNEDFPFCSLLTYTSAKARNRRIDLTYFILRQVPNLLKQGDISTCMDIELLDHTFKPNHTYNLDFNVIGRIEK